MRHWIAAGPALLLIACGSGGGNESGGGGGLLGGGSVSLQPGMWETTIQFSSIEIPGAPPEAVAQMREMATRPQTQSQCLTPEQAANPAGNMMNPGGGANCQFSDNTFSGGSIRVRGSCTQPGGQGTAQMSMEGSYTATTMQAQITSEVQAPPGAPQAGPQLVRMAGTFSSRRTGDCPAG